MAENPPQKRHFLRWAVIALVVAGIAIYWIRSVSPAVMVVRTTQVTRQDLVVPSSTNGVTEPVNDFEAHSPLATTIKSVFVHEGDHVPSGKLLLTLDDSSAVSEVARAQAAVRAAQADLSALQQGGTKDERIVLGGQISASQSAKDQAQRDLDTLKRLQASGSASQSEVEAAQRRVDSANAALTLDKSRQTGRYAPADFEKSRASLADAQAQYAAARETVGKSNVRAPFAGTVYSLPVRPSEFVQVGDKLLRIADLSRLQIRAYFDEPEIGRLKPGQPAIYIWAAHPERTWHGHVVQMPSSIVHYGTRNVGEVVLSVDETDGSLLPDTNVTVTVTTYQSASVLTIPREALHTDAKGSSFVFALADNRLRRRDIRTGAVNMTDAEVLDGLNSGEVIVLGSASGAPLAAGMKARAAE